MGEKMCDSFSRTAFLLGTEAMEQLSKARVAVFGIGGVGGFTVEALARSGIGTFDLIDNDKVSLTNINRQIIATRKTIGRYKVDVMKERILDINPDAIVNIYPCFYLPDTAKQFDFSLYSYIVDAVDTVTAKIELVFRAQEKNVPIISSMGAGNKLDPTRFEVADIYETSVCPLAKVMRKELKLRGVKKLKVVYSREQVCQPVKYTLLSCCENGISLPAAINSTGKNQIYGSVSFVPSVAGLIIAGEVIKDLAFYTVSNKL
jgi:tRNA A37 threonylcarbamoyladenosine dehydratase